MDSPHSCRNLPKSTPDQWDIQPQQRRLTWLRSISVGVVILVALTQIQATAQPNDRALLLGLGAGLSLYHGEFNSFQDSFSPTPGLSLAGYLQYNISEFIAVGGTIASSHLNYSVNPFLRSKYSSNFFGPAESTLYPGSTVEITEDNDVSTFGFQLHAKLYLHGILPEDWTLFGFGGLGMISFSPTNNLDTPLPKNLTGTYDETALMIPFGGGAEYEISDKWRAFVEYTFHSGFTDYLDGYAHFLDFETTGVPSGPGAIPTQSDHHSTLRAGIFYEIFRREPEPEIPEAPPPSQNNPLGEQDPASNAGTVEEEPGTDPIETEEPRAELSIERVPPAHERLEESQSAMKSTDHVDSDVDSDGDLLSDREETELLGTDPFRRDSDGDGLDDGEEVRLYATDPLAADSDGDLLSDLSEVRYHGTSPRSSDTDRDFLTDNEELSRTGTDPLAMDSDGDGVIDGEDDCPLEPGSRLNRGCPGSETTIDESPGPEFPQLAPGERREFSNIFFKGNSDEFDFSRPETEENLNALRDFLNGCERVGILVEGHTSSEGKAAWNLKLSAMRAQKVESWLIDQGVQPDKIIGTVGYGSRLPKLLEPDPSLISPEAVERVRAQNRRITTLIREPCVLD